MRKLYLFLAMVLALGTGQLAKAQETITVYLNSEQGDFGSDNGTSKWQKRWTSNSSNTLEGFVMLISANNMDVTYTDTKGFSIAPGTALSTTITLTAPTGYNIQSFSFTADNTNGSSEKTITVGSTEYTIAVGESPEISATDIGANSASFTYAGSNSVMTFEDFEVVVAEQTALEKLMSVYQEYVDYSGTFETSTDQSPGTYDTDAVAAFEAALLAAEKMDDPDADEMTDEEMLQLAQDIIDAYDAVTASRVPLAMTVADGYYFIQTYPFFYYTVTTEDTEDPETGEIVPGESTTVYTAKSMYSLLSGSTISAKWDTSDGTAPYLWKITTVDADNKTYQLVNMGTDAQIQSIATSTAVTMSTDIDTTMVFDYAGTYNDTIYYNIRMSGGTEDGKFYAHTSGHSSGAGTSGNIVGWNSTFDTTPHGSDWALIPVSDEEAAAIIEAYAPYKDAVSRQANTETILEDVEPKLEIAEDVTTNISGEGLITSVDQLSSPYTESSEGSLDALIDGTVSSTSFWHSAWSGGTVDDGIHYLQVELTDPSEISTVVFTLSRRAVTNDHVTSMSVYGTNDGSEDVEKESCTLLSTQSLPYSSNSETLTSTVFDTQGYTYLRFYEEATTSSRGYWHMSEFQLYEAEVIENPTSQAIMMGDVYTNMVAAYDAAVAEGDSVTVETYTALKEAYDAFIAVYVDPTDLRTAISESEGTDTYIVIGTNPGQWTDNSSAEALIALLAEANAYDAAGVYTTEQSEAYIASIEEAVAAIMAAANPVETGKWYNLRFATEEMYETYDWSTSGAEATSSWDALFGKFVAVADTETGDDGISYAIALVEPETVALGHTLNLIDEAEVSSEPETAQFRFIAVGDTAYIIQNRATGLFLRAAGTSGSVTLDIQPTLWTNTAMGYGKVLTSGTDILGNDNSNLHSQLSGNVLVTWSSDNASSNSGFLIEYVENVADNYDGTDFNMSLVPGSYHAYTYPVSVTGVTASLYGVQVDGTSITLKVLENNTAAAGQPFIYIADIDDPDLYDASADEELNEFQHGYDLNITAGTSGRLNGTYEDTTAPAGSVVADGNTLVIATASTDVDANSAWINAQIEDTESTLTVTVSEDTYTAITTAVENAVKGGDIYTIDGVKVGTGNLSSVKGLKKGLYIVNGTKVLVK